MKKIGKIFYLNTKGSPIETINYYDEEKFRKDIEEAFYYGIPITVKDYSGNNIYAKECIDFAGEKKY